MVYLVGLTRGSAMVRGHLGFYERILNKINKIKKIFNNYHRKNTSNV